MFELPTIDAVGRPRDLGRAQGEALRERIQAFVAQRLRAARGYLYERGSRDLDGLLAAGAACLEATRAWDPTGIDEHLGIAEGAEVDAIELFATANMTDVRDVLLYADSDALPNAASDRVTEADREGCTALLLPPTLSAAGEVVAAQTWDLNPGDLDYVVAVHRRPDDGPETWSVTCAGCQTLVGMNEDGLWVGTTNIKTTDARPGVPYLSLLHRAIRERGHRAALDAIAAAPRAGAHTYWAADAQGAGMLECSARHEVARELGAEPLVQTNHCLAPEHVAMEGEQPTTSTRARLERAHELASAGDHDLDSLKALFADRSAGTDSINRYPEDEQGTATNACIVAFPARRELHACRGPSDRGRWQRLEFAGG